MHRALLGVWFLGLAAAAGAGCRTVSGLDDLDFGGSGGSGGTGSGAVCEPGAEEPCYAGPAGTEGVGLCQAGKRACSADGTAFGACEGEVVPAAETCDTLDDDDCDGQTNEGGVNCGCTPGTETKLCYSGPQGTEGVGACKAGTQTCNAAGSGFDPCVGEVVPTLNDCATPEDEDCSGEPDLCSGSTTWSKRAGDNEEQHGWSVATDATDNVFVAGHFRGSMDLGVTLTSAGGPDVFIAKLDKLGNHLWSKRYGGLGKQETSDIAVDGAGNVVAVGSFESSIDFGAGALKSSGGRDVYVVKIDPMGTTLWSKRFGSLSDDYVTGVAVDGAGNVLVLGTFKGAMNVGGSLLLSKGNSDIFVMKLAPNGDHVWVESFGDMSDQLTAAVAADSAGDVIASIILTGNVDFGGGELSSQGFDVALVKLSAAGNHVWSKRFGDGSTQSGEGLAVDAQSNVIVSGSFDGALSFGGQNLVSSGGTDVFVAKLDPEGNHLWSNKYGDGAIQRAYRVGVDATGNVLVTGDFEGVLNFGNAGDELTGVGTDAFVAKLTPLGAHIWSKRYGATSAQRGLDVAADSAGDVLLTGEFENAIDFGGAGNSHASAGDFDMFIAKLAK